MRYTTPQHLALGTSTACGIHGYAHRALAVTQIRDRASCRNCRRWITAEDRKAAAQPKNVTP